MPDTRPETPPVPPARPRRGLRLVLFASLALNLLVVGLVAGAALRWYNSPFREIGRDPMMQVFGAAPSANDRTAWRERAPERGADRLARLQELSAALRADEFRIEAVAVLLAAERAAMVERIESRHAGFLERLDGLSPEQRAAFADRLDRIAARAAPRNGERP